MPKKKGGGLRFNYLPICQGIRSIYQYYRAFNYLQIERFDMFVCHKWDAESLNNNPRMKKDCNWLKYFHEILTDRLACAEDEGGGCI